MRKTYKIEAMQTASIAARLARTDDTKTFRRLQAVLFLSQGRSLEEVSKLTGFCTKSIRNFGYAFHEKGLDSFGIDGRKGGNNRLLNDDEAAEFLKSFEEKATDGQILTVKEMSKAYDEKVGITHKSHSSFYQLIHRMDWRKVKPRSKHPKKASDEEIESSKKLSKLCAK